ncbi:MAG: hypothetical protein E6Q97_33325 [Desulfurellales bacterium]|nr:MAG: hypothetical protein E6Q97_33325 [Desulfurellales bacterium]
MAKVRRGSDGTVLWWCPGCSSYHGAQTDPTHRNPVTNALWTWNNDTDRPTLSPSVLVSRRESLRRNPPDGIEGAELARFCEENRVIIPRCHCFIREGRIEFCADCEHALAGQTVDMVDED